MVFSHLPIGYSARPAHLQDLETVLRMRNAQSLADYGYAGLDTGTLRSSWLALNFHPGQDHWLVFDADLRPVAYGEVRDNGSSSSFEAIFATDQEAAPALPAEVGLFLLERIEARAADLADVAAPHAVAPAMYLPNLDDHASAIPYRLTSRLSARNETGRRWLEAAGYHCELTFNTMEIDLTVPPPPVTLPAGINIRIFQPGQDDRATYQVDEAASVDKGYHRPMSFDDWCKRMGRHTPNFDPSLWFLAFDGDQLVGVALNFYAPDMATAWVDHLSVLREQRGRGIGLALLQHSLNAFHHRCYPFARLSVDSHSLTNAPRLYEKAGFQTVMRYHIYEKSVSLT